MDVLTERAMDKVLDGREDELTQTERDLVDIEKKRIISLINKTDKLLAKFGKR